MERDRLTQFSEALRAASKVFDTTGEVFFRSLTEHLGAVLHVDYVSIGELCDGGRRMRTVAVSAGGTNLENLEYDLDHTPCQQVLERGRFFDHSDVQSHFPLDEFLVQMGFHSYLGVALMDSTGLRLGVMSVLSRQPLADPKIAELTLGLFAARTSVEMERRRSERALQASEKELRKLPARLLVAQDQERRRIARELHDTTAQNISAIHMNLARLEREGVSASAAKILADCQALCEASQREIRTLSYLLHPPLLDEVGLLSAVRWFVDGLRTRSGLRVTLDAPHAMERLPATMERDLFLVAQEALLNVVRHSGSDTAEVRVERQATHVMVQIRDAGRGISGAESAAQRDWAFVGVGIPSMRERLRQNGGELEILSGPHGTTVIGTVPIPAEKMTDPLLVRRSGR